MQRERQGQYALAGVHAVQGMPITVSSHVRLPDGEAGCESYREPYRAYQTRHRARREIYVSRSFALLLLTVLFVVFGTMILCRMGEKTKLCKEISASESRIADIARECTDLQVQVAEARDSARISYAAVQRLGMVDASGVDTIQVIAPNTRPYQLNTGMAESSPFSAGQGMISGRQ